jgi:dCMP deaminase
VTLEQTTMNKWDKRFFSLCKHVSTWSEDESRKVGSVIIGNAQEIRSTGYNGLPRGLNSDIAVRHEKLSGEKYFWYEHAERNAIYNAARIGVGLQNTTMYSSLFPCADCARAIVQSGITCLKTFKPPSDDPSYAHSFGVAEEILRESGIELITFDRDYFEDF